MFTLTHSQPFRAHAKGFAGRMAKSVMANAQATSTDTRTPDKANTETPARRRNILQGSTQTGRPLL